MIDVSRDGESVIVNREPAISHKLKIKPVNESSQVN